MFDMDVNIEVGKMSKTSDVIIFSGLYWPILFIACYILPLKYPDVWASLPKDSIIIAFISACFISIWPYAAWCMAWKRAKEKLQLEFDEKNKNVIDREQKLNNIRGLITNITSAEINPNLWTEDMTNTINRLKTYMQDKSQTK